MKPVGYIFASNSTIFKVELSLTSISFLLAWCCGNSFPVTFNPPPKEKRLCEITRLRFLFGFLTNISDFWWLICRDLLPSYPSLRLVSSKLLRLYFSFSISLTSCHVLFLIHIIYHIWPIFLIFICFPVL